MTVIIVPRLFVFVSGMFRSDSFKSRLNVMVHQPRLIFDSRNTRGGSDVEKTYDPLTHAASGNSGLDITRDIDYIAITLGMNLYRVCFDHEKQV
jgi:hypothetical protein